MALYTLKNAQLFFSDRVYLLNIDHIQTCPHQPRRVFDQAELEKLADSIARYGLIQPIAVRKNEKGYELIAGERRLRACKLAGLSQIRAVVLDVSEMEAALIALSENLQRQDLNFFEEAQGYSRILAEYHITQRELADKLSLVQSTISNKLRLLRLSPEIKDYILQHGLSERHARALLRLQEEQDQLYAARQMAEKQLSALQSEALVENMLQSRESILQKANKPHGLWRDWRIFANSMRTAVEDLRARGMNADFHMNEVGNRVEMIITIPKK